MIYWLHMEMKAIFIYVSIPFINVIRNEFPWYLIFLDANNIPHFAVYFVLEIKWQIRINASTPVTPRTALLPST